MNGAFVAAGPSNRRDRYGAKKTANKYGGGDKRKGRYGGKISALGYREGDFDCSVAYSGTEELLCDLLCNSLKCHSLTDDSPQYRNRQCAKTQERFTDVHGDGALPNCFQEAAKDEPSAEAA
uniref:Uncharacterized protein n=1 Tax=Craspedostauros australis TaxID=1486917 RepID=A0A7R9WW08_9STRA|mmetsp:Transcript_20182/g.56238  ORF Transcript_20182/g.56238 Transcript_20182/m.56238 type:complete len:122 (+) Transcript_20182:810-1175(+)